MKVIFDSLFSTYKILGTYKNIIEHTSVNITVTITLKKEVAIKLINITLS